MNKPVGIICAMELELQGLLEIIETENIVEKSGTTFYKGKILADGDMTLNQLNQKTSKEVKTTSASALKIKGSTKVGEAEKMFDEAFGVTVQIKDKEGKACVPNDITIGQAARGEY